MSEHDAHNALTATARMRALAEPVEDGNLMTFSERMYRAREARTQQLAQLYSERLPDFRDGRREARLTPHEIAQQDGFPDSNL